ncbi:hypothetical protein BH09PSE1_BH09PSE1_29510 [soil metagenome]
MSLPTPSEFQSVDGFSEPADGGVLFSIPPVLIGAILLLLLAALMLGWFLGGRRRAEEDPSQAIYDAVKKAMSAAAGAPRDSVMITARHLKTVLDERLGAVMRLGHGLGGPHEALEKALEGLGEAEHDDAHDKPKDKDREKDTGLLGAVRKVTINARSVVVNASHPGAVAEAEHDDPHGKPDKDEHGHAPGHGGHGHGKPLDAKAQLVAVRAAVHEFSDYWSDKPARLKDLREARRQLTMASTASSGDRVWDRAR